MVQEGLIRDEIFLAELEQWKNSGAKMAFLWKIREEFELFLTQGQTEFIELEKNDKHAMVYFFPMDEWEDNEADFFIDYIKDRFISIGYYKYMSDQKSEFLDGGLKQITFRHYLKPWPVDIKPESNYGNISIELIKQKNKTRFIRLLCTYYSERLSLKPKSIENLMEFILS